MEHKDFLDKVLISTSESQHGGRAIEKDFELTLSNKLIQLFNIWLPALQLRKF